MSNPQTQRRPQLFAGQPIDEVLVPIQVDRFDARGLSVAARVAGAWDLPVRLVHVHGTDEVGYGTDGTDEVGTGTDVIEARFAAAHPELNIDSFEVHFDDVPSGIAASALPGSLVLLATEHASQWLGLASVAEAVTRIIDGAVLLCGPKVLEPNVAGPIIVPLDGSPRSERALDYAIAMAANNDQTLRLVSVVDEATVDHVAKLKARGETVTESGYLRSVAERLAGDGVDVAWEVIHAKDPVVAITDFAAARKAGMIVAATHGESALARRVFGSVCMGMVETGSAPVLVVKTGPADTGELNP